MDRRTRLAWISWWTERETQAHALAIIFESQPSRLDTEFISESSQDLEDAKRSRKYQAKCRRTVGCIRNLVIIGRSMPASESWPF